MRAAAAGVGAVALGASVMVAGQAGQPNDRPVRAPLVISRAVVQRVQRGDDSVPVIVAVRTPFRVDGTLLESDAALQRTAIALAQDELIRAVGGARNLKRFETIPYLALTVDAAALDALARVPEVAVIYEDAAIPMALAQSGPLIGAPDVWAQGLAGDGWTVAILDTGVESTHPFLTGKVVSEACYSTNGVGATSLCPGGVPASTAPGSGLNCPLGACGHGTHVAGIAAGRGAAYSGIARGSTLISIQVFSNFSGSLAAFDSDLILALERVYALRSSFSIAAVNMSLGSQSGYADTAVCDASFPAIKAAIDNLRSAGIATVVSAGNQGFDDRLSYPACISSAVSVGSTTKLNRRSGYSNVATFLSLFAPGEPILSSAAGGIFTTMSGTSMAAPHVAGAWAIMKQATPAAGVAEILARLSAGGLPISTQVGITKPRISLTSGVCSHAVTFQRAAFGASGGGGTATVNTGAGCSWTASSLAPWITITAGHSGTGSGMVSFDVSPSTSASRVGQLNIAAHTRGISQRTIQGDFTGDGRADPAVFRPQSGVWYVGEAAHRFGIPSDIPVPADYNGDRRVDLGVFRPESGVWYIEGRPPLQFGRPGDIPVPADYDGDGRTDVAVFRPSSGWWYVDGVSSNLSAVQFGMPGDIPVPGDYSGDGRFEAAVLRDGWIWLVHGAQAVHAAGTIGDIPVPDDFDGDGRTDAAAFRPSTGEWIISQFTTQFGAPGDLPFTTDLDGDGRPELAVFRRATGVWYSLNRTTGATQSFQYGAPGDVPAVMRPQYRRQLFNDFNGDRRSGIAVFSATGTWDYFDDGVRTGKWGIAGDLATPADYDGDGRSDLAVFRPANGYWYLGHSANMFASYRSVKFGISTDVPVPADYDGDGKADVAVFRPSTGVWYIGGSATDFAGERAVKFGIAGDIPVRGDYDGDGRYDIAVFRPATGVWYYAYSSTDFATYGSYKFGVAGDKPVPGDYDADGRTDIAVFRPATGMWYLGWSSSGFDSYRSYRFGFATDVPVTGDFDGDGATDIGVYRPSTYGWYLGRSSTGFTDYDQRSLGAAGATPVPYW